RRGLELWMSGPWRFRSAAETKAKQSVSSSKDLPFETRELQPLFLRARFSITLPMNWDWSFCAQPSPQTCSAPSCTASFSSHGARCMTSTPKSSNELHIIHQRSLTPFWMPQLGPAQRYNELGIRTTLSDMINLLISHCS